MSIDLTNPIFHDDAAARAHLEAQRWPNGPICAHCGERHADKITKLEGKAHRAGLYQCKTCREQFSVTVGTVFERSKVPLAKWVLATHLMAASKKGMSAKQIERMLGVTYKTAWFMMHRIREAMSPSATDTSPIGGTDKIVESDETFVGGKAKNAKRFKPVPKKYPVVALIERGGPMRAKHVADVTGKNVRKALVTNVSRKSMLMTDDAAVYERIGKEFYAHGKVNHSAGQYADEIGFKHINTCESYFALLKRGIMGSFHSVSEAHLQRYADEFAFRWNHRKTDDAERANAILKAAEGKRLTYRRSGEAGHA
ncbi:transposase [Candidatus Filomicrobium marinum]|uniref:Transposase n=1 Tax=Candidatus Filomicrobium marinum TaxID=1608628 RepID=A0A0D6JFX1_9HYPH|nr:IS1595 family transposase [Candidatus Filomicrobium marinum]CFX28083.1 transposase [Candidatus Filomicrobium marinum]CPR19641.1 transposase [Candidatus Filomicrobium marinum]